MVINGYKLRGELQNANSGFSKWGYAVKNGREFFIKELIDPVYPLDRSVMSEEMFMQRRMYCDEYEAKFRRFFERLNAASCGNLVRVEEFFRFGSRYYIVTERVDGRNIPMSNVAAMTRERKLILLKTVARSFSDLHSAGIVHFDVKPANILLKVTKSGNLAAKIIDFDSGFFKGEALTMDDLGGDLAYLAPETFRAIYGEPVRPDEKADIFALGLIFHEYYCGYLPAYDERQYEYPYESVLDGAGLAVDTNLLPEALGSLIASMLVAEPELRPSAEEILSKLKQMGIEQEASDVKSFAVRFGDYYGKTITIERGSVRFRNTLHPLLSAETVNFPPSYSEQYEKELGDEEFLKIANEVFEAGLIEMLSKNKEPEYRPGSVYQNMTVMFRDGSSCEYSTLFGEENPQFDKIIEILSRDCEFPPIDPEWYENVAPPEPVVSVAPVVPPVAPVEPATVAVPSPEYEAARRNGEWFSRAGDL